MVAFIIFRLRTWLINQQSKHTAECHSKPWARGGISTFHASPNPDSVITGFLNLMSSGFFFLSLAATQCAGNIFSSAEAKRSGGCDSFLNGGIVRSPRYTTTSPSVTAALCQCGQSVLVGLVSMANEWNPKTAPTLTKKKENRTSVSYFWEWTCSLTMSTVSWTAWGIHTTRTKQWHIPDTKCVRV